MTFTYNIQLYIPISQISLLIANISPINKEYTFALHIFLKRINFDNVSGTKRIAGYSRFRNSVNYILQLQSVQVYLDCDNYLLSIYYLQSNAITQKPVHFLNKQ